MVILTFNKGRLSVFIFKSSTCASIQFHLWHFMIWNEVEGPGKSHGQRSLVGCNPWGCWELDITERLHFHFSLSFTGEGNGNLLQCSSLEYPRDGGPGGLPCGVAQNWTRLKPLSSSNSIYRTLRTRTQSIRLNYEIEFTDKMITVFCHWRDLKFRQIIF